MASGVAYGLGEAFFVAIIYAAIRNVAYYVFTKFIQTIIFHKNALNVDSLTIIFQAIATSLVFCIWVDVGIVPKNRRFDALGSQAIYTIYAARCAAGMHQNFFHRNFLNNSYIIIAFMLQ